MVCVWGAGVGAKEEWVDNKVRSIGR